jgi:hypothetical protein
LPIHQTNENDRIKEKEIIAEGKTEKKKKKKK